MFLLQTKYISMSTDDHGKLCTRRKNSKLMPYAAARAGSYRK